MTTSDTDLSAFTRSLRGSMSLQVEGDERLYAEAVDGLHIGLRLARSGEAWVITETAVFSPARPLSPEDLRRVPYATLLTEARSMLAVSERPRAARRLGVTSPGEVNLSAFFAGRGGNRRITDQDYALLALTYVLLVQDGDRSPARTLSERYGHGSPSQWSNRIAEARRRGLLSPARKGAPGGRLTRTAERLLGES